MSREVPKLSVLVLKEISKAPSAYLNLNSFYRACKIIPQDNFDIDIIQILVNYITEAGRLVDDVISIEFFHPNRTRLTLKNTKLSPRYLARILNRCPLLEVINFGGTFQVDDTLVLTTLQKCANLKSLNIQNCRKISDTTLHYICQPQYENLISLNIGGDVNITEKALISFINSLKAKQFTELFLSGLTINDTLLSLIQTNCTRLTKIGLNFANISEDALKQFLLSSIGINITVLHIGWLATPGVGTPSDSPEKYQLSSDFFTDFLVSACPKLVELDISGLKCVNVNIIQQYLENRLHLIDLGQAEHTLQYMKAKFIGSSRTVLEQQLLNIPYLKVEL